MHRFFLGQGQIQKDKIILCGEDVHHIKNVLRLKPQDFIEVCDEKESNYIVEIGKISPQEILGTIINKKPIFTEPKTKITLAPSLLKKNKLDLITDLSVQLGVYKIIPFISSRTVVKNPKIKRWQKIAHESAQLSRGIIPEVREVLNWEELLKTFNNYDLVIFPWEEEKTTSIKDVFSCKTIRNRHCEDSDASSEDEAISFETASLRRSDVAVARSDSAKSVLLIIGPEGGFTKEEAKSVKEKGAQIVTLGPRLLKAETAAIFALSSILTLTS